MHWHRLVQLHAAGAHRLARTQTGAMQLFLVVRHAGALRVHAQGHGGRLLGARQQVLPVLRVVALQALDPPQRMVPERLRVGIGLRHQGCALTQEASQAGVDEPGLCLGLTLAARGLHRLADQGVTRVRRLGFIPAQGQGAAQQGIHRGRRFAVGQQRTQGPCTSQLPHDLKTQGLYARAQGRRHRIQLRRERFARPHRLHSGSGVLKQLPQGWRLYRRAHAMTPLMPARAGKRKTCTGCMCKRVASQLAGACNKAVL